jgi:hypothetical protein
MAENANLRLYLNRFVSFLIGGALVFAAMSLTVVAGAAKSNAILASELDASRNDAGRLLGDAQAQLAAGEFAAARGSLDLLFKNRAGSAESVEGKTLLAAVDKAELEANARWEAALPALRVKWVAARAAVLRAEAEADRAAAELALPAKLDLEWNQSKDQVRLEWEKAARL